MTPQLEQYLSVLRDYLNAIHSFIDESGFYPRNNVYSDKVLFALISKAIRVGESVCLLVEDGYGEEAFGLSRTLMDIGFTVRYIANKDTLERAKRFAEFYGKDHSEWVRLAQKYAQSPIAEFSPDHDRLMELSEKYRSPHAWTGLGGQTKVMAMEPDEYEKDGNGNPFTEEFVYEVMYKWTSHFVHVTVSSLDSHAPDPGWPFKVFSGKQRAAKDETALFHVLMSVHKILIGAFRALKIESPDSVSKTFTVAEAVFSR